MDMNITIEIIKSNLPLYRNNMNDVHLHPLRWTGYGKTGK